MTQTFKNLGEVSKSNYNGKLFTCSNYVCRERTICIMKKPLNFSLSCKNSDIKEVDPVNGIPKFQTRILAV